MVSEKYREVEMCTDGAWRGGSSATSKKEHKENIMRTTSLNTQHP